jgi:hypothetical protein
MSINGRGYMNFLLDVRCVLDCLVIAMVISFTLCEIVYVVVGEVSVSLVVKW